MIYNTESTDKVSLLSIMVWVMIRYIERWHAPYYELSVHKKTSWHDSKRTITGFLVVKFVTLPIDCFTQIY